MRIVLSGLAFLSSTVTGYIFAAKASSMHSETKELLSCLKTLRTHIVGYNEGLTKAIYSSGINKTCPLFADIISSHIRNEENIISLPVEQSPYSDEIKYSLSFLFRQIEKSGDDDVIKAFDTATELVEKVEEAQRLKKERDAPLYRKAGILSGLAFAILLL